MTNGTISNRDLYDNLDKLRMELKNDIQGNNSDLRQDIRGLRADFNTMEAGRLTHAESKINKLELTVEAQMSKLRANQSIANSKIILIWSLIIIAINLIGAYIVGRLG